jgi:hypothetical protein
MIVAGAVNRYAALNPRSCPVIRRINVVFPAPLGPKGVHLAAVHRHGKIAQRIFSPGGFDFSLFGAIGKSDLRNVQTFMISVFRQSHADF